MVVQRLPAVLHVPAGNVARQRIPRVVAHEARQVAVVPVAGAPLEHRRDLGLQVARDDLRGRAGEHQQRARCPRPSPCPCAHRCPLRSKGRKRAAGAPRGDGQSHPKRRSRAVTSNRLSGGASSPPSAVWSCRPALPWPWDASCRPSSWPWVSPVFSASSPAWAAAPSWAHPASARERAATSVPADTSAPSSRSRSSCSPKNRLARASDDFSSAGCPWAWPIAYPGNAPTQVDAGPTAVAPTVSRVSRQVSLTTILRRAYLRAVMTARSICLLTVLACPGAVSAQNIAEVQVAPPSVTIKIGERSGLLATAFDRAGNVISTVRVIWSSNNVAVAKVDNNGTVTGVGGGVAIVEARAGARKGQAAVQVVGAAAPSPAPAAGGAS